MGQKFNTTEGIQVESHAVMNTLTKGFQDAFHLWQKHWDWYVSSNRDYFEGGGSYDIILFSIILRTFGSRFVYMTY